MVNDCNKVSNAETETHSRFARVFKEDKLVLKAGKAEKTRPWEAISILYKPTLRAVMHGCALYAISGQDVLREVVPLNWLKEWRIQQVPPSVVEEVQGFAQPCL